MAQSKPPKPERLTAIESLRAQTIQITLKFVLTEIDCEYSCTDASNSIIEQLYADAEKFTLDIINNLQNGKQTGRYVINLYRISSSDSQMVPIVQSTDVEHNSIMEILLVPVKNDENPHCLYECKLNKPTHCSKCTRFIGSFHQHGFRCRKCRMAYHKECAPFLEDNCPIEPNETQNGKASSKSMPSLMIINPFPSNSVSTPTPTPPTPVLPVSNELSPVEIHANTIIDKGIFPARIGDGSFYGRYLFRLSPTTLNISTNLSPKNVSQTELSTSINDDMSFSLADIQDLILTHFIDGRDSIFEIHLRNGNVINVGKKTDPDQLQMNTAQFYSSIRDQRETLANATPSASSSPLVANVITSTTSPKPISNHPRKLRGLKSIVVLGDAELHDRYAFTGEKLGEGAFGRVMGAIKKANRESRAIKIIEKRNCTELEIRRITDEARHLYTFNHINILKLEAYYERDDAVYLVTERMETDMCEYITNSPNHYLEEETSKMLIYQLIVALRYLHDNECGHLDIKCENILLTFLRRRSDTKDNKLSSSGNDSDRDFPLIKLADFGYSRIIGEHSFRKTRVGTKVYSPPEMYNSITGYNRLADMWSAGIVMYASLSGTLPFNENSYSNPNLLAIQRREIFSDERWAYMSVEAIELLDKKLIVIDVNSRAKTNDILFHDWFTDFQLYKNLREIERRTRSILNARHEEATPATNWLTIQRNDPVWDAYRSNLH
ncbi:hypothetical protein I4U23_012618 [Adineta vaga]|nr:hypothetical protein I4U23_012618 [Adineta vaga]